MKLSDLNSRVVRQTLLGVAALAVFAFSNAHAQNIQLSKKFIPLNQQFNPGEAVQLRFEIFNNTNNPITNVAFSDFFTDDGLTGGTRSTNQLLVQSPFNGSGVLTPAPTNNGNCGTPIVSTNTTAVGGRPTASELVFTGITVPPQDAIGPGTCQISVTVSSQRVGANTNFIPGGVLTSSLGVGAGNTNDPVSETLTIRNIAEPSVFKSFSAVGTSDFGGNLTTTTGTTARMVVRVFNKDGTQPINTVRLVDLLPPGLQYVTAFTPTFTGCVAPSNVVFSSSGNPGSLANDTATITTSRIDAATNCDVEFRVKGDTGGVFTNNIPASSLTTREGLTNFSAASATLTYQSLSSFKAFNPGIVDLNGTGAGATTKNSVLSLTITNPQSVAVPNVAVTDYFSTTGAAGGPWNDLEISTPVGASVLCSNASTVGTFVGMNLSGSPTVSAPATGDRAIRVTGLTIPADGNCIISVNVRGKAGIADGNTFTINRSNTLLGTNIRTGDPVTGTQAVFADTTAFLNIVPPGVTGRNIIIEKSVTIQGDASVTNPASNAQYRSLAVIIRTAPNVPDEPRTAWYRIRLAVPATSGTVSGVTFTDDLPDGLDYDNVVTSNCLNDASPPASITPTLTNTGNKTLAVSGLSLSGSTNACAITFRVRSSNTGTFFNTIPAFAVRSSGGESNPSSADATVGVVDPIRLDKSFTPSLIGPNGVSRVRVTINNFDFTRALTGVALTDDLALVSGGLTINNPPNTSTTCTTDGTTLTTVNATAGGTTAGVSGVRLNQAARSGNGSVEITPTSCSFDFDVKSDSGTTDIINRLPDNTVSTNERVSNTDQVQATLRRSGIAISVVKQFQLSNIGPSNPVQLTVELANNSGGTLTGINFTDYFTDTGQSTGTYFPLQIANPANASTTCTNGTVTATAASDPFNPVPANQQFTLNNATIPNASSCKVSVDVTGYTSGGFINTIPAGTAAAPTFTSTQGNLLSDIATSSTTVQQELGMRKTFTPTTILPGSGTSVLRIEIFNAFPGQVTNIALTDYFTSDGTSGGTPTGIVVAATPGAGNTCGGTFVTTPGAAQIALTDGTLTNTGTGRSCVLTVNVNANKVSGGTYDNLIPAANLNGVSGATPVPARRPTSATLTTPPPPTISKVFNPTSILPGQTSSLTITLTNPTGTAATLTAPLVDTLPTGFVVSGAASSTCGSPSINVTPSTTTPGVITATALTIPAALATCTITVPVTNDTTNNFGTRDNVIPAGALQTTIGNNPTAATAPITLEQPLVGYKSVRLTTDADNSQTITTGDTVTWSVFYKNTSSIAVSGVQIVDLLSTGVTRTGAAALTATLLNPAGAAVGVNGSYTGVGNNNLLSAGQNLAAGQVVQVDIPVIVTASSGNQDNRAEATYTGQPVSFPNTQTDTADATTTGLPAGITIPTGAGIFAAVSQTPTQTSATNDFTRVAPLATPQAQGWKFVARTSDRDGNRQNTIGDELTWSVFYKNTGTVAINGIQIADVLPAGLTYNSITLIINSASNVPNANSAYNGTSANANLITGTLNLAPGDVVRVDIVTTINSSVPANGQLDNSATLTAANLPTAGIRTDAGDTTTTLPAGFNAPSGSQPQTDNQTAGLDPTRATVSPIVSGKVYVDLNNNGAFDAGEPGIPGATVTVTPSSGPVITLTTNGTGDYVTPVPAGSTVTITETQPPAYGNGKRGPVNPDTNTISLGVIPPTGSSGNNFGEIAGTVSGKVYTDANNDGSPTGDTGISGQTVTLTGTDFGPNGVLGGGDDVPVSYSTTTNATGDYSFTPNATNITGTPAFTGNFPGLRAGSYTVTEPNQPLATLSGITTPGSTGGTATAPTVTPSVISAVPLAAGQTSSGNNFGEIAPSSLRGKVFETFDNDAVQDAGENNNLGGTTVTLTYTDDLGRTIVQTATTAAGNVAAGATTNTISINDAPATTVTLTGAPALTAGQYYFGNVRPTQTGTTYTVTETQPATFSSNPANTAAGSAGGTTTTNNVVSAIPSLAPGTNATGYDFAEYLPVTISGIVFAERGAAGSNYLAGTDVPIQGATVSLRDGSGNPISTVPDQTTPASGAYSFTNLPPGAYQVVEPTQPAGTTNQDTYPGTLSGGQTAGSAVGTKLETPSRVTGIVAQSGNTFSNVNFGETFVAGISGVVYRDLNDDGQIGGTGETGISGIRVELRDATNVIVVIGGVPQVATTDGSGAYSFNNLPAGTYNVVELGRFAQAGENQDPSFFDGKAAPGTNLPSGNGTAPAGQQGTPPTRINTITLGTTPATNTSTNNNFGEIPKSTLSGKVFETFDNDAVQDAGEPALGGTTVTLTYTDVNGRTVVQTTTTAPAGGVLAGATTNTISVSGGAPTTTTCSSAPALTAGQYYFCEILPLQTDTTYTVTETQPAGFSSNPANTAAGTSGGNTTVNNVVSGVSFTPGTNATGYDFAEYKPVTISGVVFAERNNTPNYQSGVDDPIPGATVSLRDSSGNPIAGVPDQTTPASGAFSFTNLPPGAYQVVEPTQPIGTINDATFGGTVAGGQTSGSSGGTPTPVATTPSAVTGIVTQSGNTVSDVNFGERYDGRISGVVFEDRNNNGIQEANEPAIPGIVVRLTGPTARPDVVTGANGEYEFTQLQPGTYTVTEFGFDATQNQAPIYGNGQSIPGTSGATTNGTGSPVATLPSTITGIVLGSTPATNNSAANNFGELTADLELAKTVDNAAPSIGGTVKFTLQVTNKGLADATGVSVEDVLPAGFTYVSSTPSAGVTVAGQTLTWNVGTVLNGATASLEVTATVNAGQPAAAYINAAEVKTSTIKDPDSTPGDGTSNPQDDRATVTVTPRGNINGTVFRDENGNGVRDPGENPIPGATVTITPTGGGTPVTLTTDANGVYDTSTLTTPGVPAGTYSVQIDESTLPADYRNQSAGTNPTPVTVASGENKKEEDNGYRPTGTVNGSVFVDTNGNGVRDAGEPGVPNAPVTVSRPNVPGTTPFAPVTVVTDANGNYTVPGVPTGAVVVTVADADPALNGLTRVPNDPTANPGGNNPTPITVVNGNNNAGDDPFRNEGSVKERVFQDTNGNGVQDPGEPGIQGVTVRVTDAGGKILTGVTDANGDVTIPGVIAGTATVTVDVTTLPPGLASQTAGVNPSTVTVTTGQTADAGFDGYQPRGTVGGLVWRDDNGDGIRDPNEPVFPGITVTITDQFGKVTTVVTGPDGRYSAPVASGPVTVVYTDPVNHRLTTNNNTQTVTVPTNGNVNAVDVGYQPLTGGLEGRVFFDTNANGVQDPGEPGVPDVTVTITDAKGAVVTLKTDANGDYKTAVNQLAFGPAKVVVTPPPGLVVTTNNLEQTVNVPAGSVGRVPNVGLVRPGITLEKNVVQGGVVVPRTQTPTVNLGGNLEYQISVTNSGPIAVRGLVITDTLPVGLRYLPGTSKLEGTALTDPTVTVVAGKQVLVWNFPAGEILNPGAVKRIRFTTIVTPETRGDQLINTAVAQATTGPTGSPVVVASNASTAAVKVELGVFSNKSVIVGRVYFDVNDNDSFEVDSDQPLPGARVYLSDGRSAVTDNLGRYSIPDVEPGVYTVRLDPVTAPYAVKSTPDMQGAPGSRYVKAASDGGITHEDFLLVKPSAVGVKSRSTVVRRGAVTLTKAITQGGAGYAVTITITVNAAVRNLSITDPLPANAERGPVIGATLEGNTLRFAGVTQPGTYTVTYALFTAAPPDLVLTDPDINYEQIFTLIPSSPTNTGTQESDEVIR